MNAYSIIQKSHLDGAHRLDAEYYQPKYLELENKFSTLNTKTVEEVSESVISFGAYSLTNYIKWQQSGVPYVNVGDIHNGYIDLNNVKYISEKVDKILEKSRVNEGQVLLTMAGTIGNAAVVHNFPKRANANQAIAKITPLKNISPYYLAAFLNSKYGTLQTQREIVSSVQANIFLGPIKKFRVPIFSNEVIEKIEHLYKSFLNELEISKSLYSQAENLLLEELGLKDFQPEDDLSFVVNLSDVQSAHRADAEFFQPSIQRLIEHIVAKGSVLIKDIQTFNRRGIQPKYTEGGEVKVVTSKHLGLSSIDYDNLGKTTIDEWKSNTNAHVNQHDVLIYTTGANVGRTNCYLENDKVLASNHVNILRAKAINSIYLAVFLNSVLGQKQIRRLVSGSAQVELYPGDIEELVVWNAPESTQSKIADLVQQSHVARKKSKELLEEAKRKVEEMIEKGTNEHHH